MCLYMPANIVLPKVKVALEDIHVYKVMADGSEGIFSPFYNTLYLQGEVKVSELDEPVYKRVYRDDVNGWVDCWTISKGLHACVSLESAGVLLNRLGGKRICWAKSPTGKIMGGTLTVFSAVIPKGSLYHEGDGGEIASNQLQLGTSTTMNTTELKPIPKAVGVVTDAWDIGFPENEADYLEWYNNLESVNATLLTVESKENKPIITPNAYYGLRSTRDGLVKAGYDKGYLVPRYSVWMDSI